MQPRKGAVGSKVGRCEEVRRKHLFRGLAFDVAMGINERSKRNMGAVQLGVQQCQDAVQVATALRFAVNVVQASLGRGQGGQGGRAVFHGRCRVVENRGAGWALDHLFAKKAARVCRVQAHVEKDAQVIFGKKDVDPSEIALFEIQEQFDHVRVVERGQTIRIVGFKGGIRLDEGQKLALSIVVGESVARFRLFIVDGKIR